MTVDTVKARLCRISTSSHEMETEQNKNRCDDDGNCVIIIVVVVVVFILFVCLSAPPFLFHSWYVAWARGSGSDGWTRRTDKVEGKNRLATDFRNLSSMPIPTDSARKPVSQDPQPQLPNLRSRWRWIVITLLLQRARCGNSALLGWLAAKKVFQLLDGSND